MHSRKQHLNTSHQTTRAIKQFYISNSIQVLWSSGRALALNTNGFGFKSHHFQKIFYFFLRYAKFLFAISSPKMHRFTSLKKHLKDTPVRKITYHHPCIDKANLDVYFLILYFFVLHGTSVRKVLIFFNYFSYLNIYSVIYHWKAKTFIFLVPKTASKNLYYFRRYKPFSAYS